MDFIKLLDLAQPWLGCFDYDHYPANFASFEEQAAPFFRTLETASHEETAERLLDQVEARWAQLPRLRRGALAKKDKMVLALFFTPAARRHSGASAAFAETLRERWNGRFPRFRYLSGEYETIVKGFDTDFFGITLRKTEKRS